MTKVPNAGNGNVIDRLRRLSARLLARYPVDIVSARPIVTFTFDDFPRSALHTGGDILGRYGWRATYFASACFLGGTTHHGPMFTADDVAALLAAGHEIGCHTHDHLNAARADQKQYLADMQRNVEALKALGVPAMGSFAFPFGEAQPAHKHRAASRYTVARGIRPGINGVNSDRMLLKSVAIDGGDEGLKRALHYAAAAAEQGGWLIFFTHEVDDHPGPWGCTPGQLEAVAQAVKDAGAEVLTMGQAIARLGLKS